MKTAKELLQAYINGSALESAALFADKGVLELPYLADLGVEPRYEGPNNIEAFLTSLHEKMYPNFRFIDVNIYIDTPDQAFGEYTIHQKSGISGKNVHQRFFGHCVAADGKIVLLREALNVLAAADGMFPNGIADVINKK
jgi:uncharacterized protein